MDGSSWPDRAERLDQKSHEHPDEAVPLIKGGASHIAGLAAPTGTRPAPAIPDGDGRQSHITHMRLRGETRTSSMRPKRRSVSSVLAAWLRKLSPVVVAPKRAPTASAASGCSAVAIDPATNAVQG